MAGRSFAKNFAFGQMKAKHGWQRQQALLMALNSAAISVFFQTPDLIYRWAENLPPFLAVKGGAMGCEIDGAREIDLFDKPHAEALETSKLAVLAQKRSRELELSFPYRGRELWYRFAIDCQYNERGELLGLITSAIDISALRQREQILKTLLRELCHRSKNLLSIIQAIAGQTALFSDSIQNFMQKFYSRLQSISASQDLITHANWTGILFQELAYLQAAKLVPPNAKLTISGDDIYLYPNAALHIGLALHELLLNSSSFGALGLNKGAVQLSGALEQKGDKCYFTMKWQENFTAPAPLSGKEPRPLARAKSGQKSASQRRFGTTLLERVVPTALDGDFCYEMKAHPAKKEQQLTYRLTIGQSQFALIRQDNAKDNAVAPSSAAKAQKPAPRRNN